VSLKTGVVLTELYNVAVTSYELIGATERMSDAIDEVSPKQMSL